MKKIVPVFLLTLALQPLSSFAQERVNLSMQDCIDYALKNSNAAKNARIDVALQKAVNAEVTGSTLPQISGEGKYTQFFDIQKAFLPNNAFPTIPGAPAPTEEFSIVAFNPKLSNVGSLNASQLLFNGSVFVALQARNTLMTLARQKEQMTNEEIRYNVQKAYAALLIIKRQFEVMGESLALMRKSASDLKITYDNGMVEKLEVNRLEVQLSNLEADSMGLGNSIGLSERLLKYTIGMDLNTEIVLIDESVIDNATESANLLLREADPKNNISYQLAYTGVKLQEYDLKRYRFEGLPNLAAFGSAGYNRSANKFDDLVNKPYPGFSLAGLQLNIPIFDGLQRRNRVKQAKLKLEKAENDLEYAQIGIDFQTKSAKATLSNALQTAESRKRTLDLAQTVLDLEQKKYKAGVGSNKDVLTAQGDFLRAQGSYFEALLTIVNAKADLQKALGLLSN